MTQRVVNYTYGTGNPVLPNGSIDVRDGIDNLQSMDVFMNAPEDTYNQRDGGIARTVAGMNSEFDANILNMGFTRIGTFAAGATLTNPRQTLLWNVADGGNGKEYGWSGTFPKIVPASSTPSSTGGISVGAWISRFDPELRIQVREAQLRSYAEAGYNLVAGSFEAGGALVNANDVLLQESTGKAFSGPSGTVAAGTNPASGGFVDVSSKLLRTEIVGPVKVFKASQYGLTTDVTADNTAAALQMMAAAQAQAGYFEIDLQGGMYRIYAGANLNPLRLVGKRFKIKNGGFYAANASVSPTIVNFPSTITFDKCDYIAENFTCYAKGQSWGNTDASFGLDSNGRATWIAEKGGHAIAVVRSKYKHINVTGGLAGSAAAIYLPSSRGESYGGNAYCSSLGYAAYNADSWCGNPDSVGIGYFIHLAFGSNAVATEHKRPEDGSVVGTTAYCGKLGFLGEAATSADVQVYIFGGRWVGFYAGGSAMDLGGAFAATSATVVSVGSVVANAASVIRVDNSSNTNSVCKVIDVQATEIGLTGVMVSRKSFGTCDAFLSGHVGITSTRTWPASGVSELVNSSVIANRGVAITVNVTIDAVVTGTTDRFVHNSRACYGGVRVLGGDYTVSQYVAFSLGWGGSVANTAKGFVCSGRPIFRIPNKAATDEIFHWQGADEQGVSVYVYIDAADAEFISGNFRRIDFITQVAPAFRERVIFPRSLINCYALDADRPREVIEAKAVSSGGASGSNWLYKFAFPQGKPPLFPCMVALNNEIRLVLSGSGAPVVESGELVQNVFIQGAPSATAITVGNVYGLNGA